MIRGILVKPEQQPQVIEFSNGYRELQKLVEGIFEMPSIFPDVDVVINEEGKFNGSLPNRYLFYNGQLVDIIFGNMLIVDSDSEGNTVGKPHVGLPTVNGNIAGAYMAIVEERLAMLK